MPSQKLLDNNKKVIEAWENFIDNNILEREKLRQQIIDSWLRSKKYKVDSFSTLVKKELNHNNLSKRIEKYKPILDIAVPFMETIYKTVGNSGMIVRFTDSDGYVLECFGDLSVLERNKEIHLYKGTNVSEEMIGTNAIGVALKTGIALQVLGAEHYRKSYHAWTTSAAPIRDKEGKILSVLSMSGDHSQVHPHTLGMIMASALAIEHEIRLNRANFELIRANEHLDAVMQSINEGILTIDINGIITDVNYFAKKFLKKSTKNIIGNSIDELTKKPVFELIKNNEIKFDEKEIHFLDDNKKKKSVIITFKPVYSGKKDISEYLIRFRESKKVYDQVNKLVGSKAIFTFEDILGDSPKIKESIRLASLIANTDATVLLNGESGTGKELFAQGIHNASNRHESQFVFINCGAIPRDLVASELFGYEDGAFTGARKGGHPGKFEFADGGTLFLDEIGDMPLDTQANLLRVLETKEVVRVGGHDVIPVDVRVIAATHKDLKKEVENGNFRQDLFFRLNVMPITTPPLRERKEDIRILIKYFYSQFSMKKNEKIMIDESFYKVMKDYYWPGNVRELQNVMQMITNINGSKDKLYSEDLPNYLKEAIKFTDDEEITLVKPLYIVEKEEILKAIKYSSGNLMQASKILEIGRSTLYRKLEKYNIEI
ncbi:sigma-54-dependent Fis family transcriptional regulator [Helicovermis profundi]|uniref:Sigma-54-dependent Fis family transcriptional regulator n=1 Tax=Helicovermis profundi TaxID=3065157 RepID=A0AAU9EFX9_9FIRM|nr:sigma-54-dependent Fis family transcriptional regulator [Clostridia bacterium S502]